LVDEQDFFFFFKNKTNLQFVLCLTFEEYKIN
jgi:hypothetical protein